MSQFPIQPSSDYPVAPTLEQPEDLPVVEPAPADSQTSTADTAKEQAGQVKDSAAEAAQHVAGVAQEQASVVAEEAKTQTKDLLEQSRKELRDQAAAQQERVASGLRSLENELHSMADASTQDGVGADLARQAAGHAGTIADWMEGRDPGDLLQEVRSFARHRPGAFLGLAAAAGLVAGRLGRSLKDGPVDPNHSDDPVSAHVAGFGAGQSNDSGTYSSDLASDTVADADLDLDLDRR